MTQTDQEIIDAIWGEDAMEIDRATLDGIFAMAEVAAQRVEEGKFFVVPDTDSVH